MVDDNNLHLTDREIAQCFCDPVTAAKYPPILSIDQAAELIGVSLGTMRDWRSRGLLSNCSRRAGKEVRFFRDRLIKQVFNHGLTQ